MSERVQETKTARVERTQRYIRRRGGPGLALIPYGLIPAIGLALVTLFSLLPFASHWIESNAERSALTALRAEGEGWAQVSASGQWITLQGEAPNAERAAIAVQLIRDAKASTLFGQARPVTRVIDRTTLASPASNETPENTEDTSSDPDQASAPAAPSRSEATQRERVAECDRQFRGLLLDSKIEFATGSARIAPSSAGLLNQLARAVTGCELNVTIEGHTDSTGSIALNERLSRARAEAVREALVIRGVSADLLSAEGFGAARPIAENETPEGREQNRRIEFRVQSADAAEE